MNFGIGDIVMDATHDKDAGHPDMDYNEHEKTYGMFIALTKYSIIGLVILLVLMAYFLV